MKIGSQLRRARLEAGLSQKELAARAKIDRTYVIFLEQDKQSPTLDVFFRICKGLDISPTELMGRIEHGGKRSS